jgi:hypothetical protein
LSGATITIVGTGTKTNPSGMITIDYGLSGVKTNEVTRKGKIIINYVGKRLQPNSTRDITFDGYSRNSVKVEGTYHLEIKDSVYNDVTQELKITFDHVTALTLTFPDNTTIVRNATITTVWDYVKTNVFMSTVTYKAGGAATGTTRKGNEYAMSIITDIVHRADCFASGYLLPISGVKAITVVSTGRVYTIDYGTTACDNTVTVTIGGKTYSITVDKSGN